MKKIKLVLVIILSIVMFSGCQQSLTRNFGGTTTVKLEPGQRLVEVTWKDNNLWYLVEPMEPNYTPKTKEFIESSNGGVFEGKVIFIESK